MPLTQAERTQVAQSFLKCFGENVTWCGRTLRFISQFTVGQTNLLADVQAAADTWQPFLDSGLDLVWWKQALVREYDMTDVA